MITLDTITFENNKEHNKKWSLIPDHPYRILIIGDSGSRKRNALLNLIKEQDDVDKICFYAKGLSEPKYEFKREDVGTKYCNDPNTFIETSNTMVGICENMEDYNPRRKRKILIMFDDMIADMSNKIFEAIIKELFIKCRKVNISLVFITQSFFAVPKDVRLNSKHYLIIKINDRKELPKYCN